MFYSPLFHVVGSLGRKKNDRGYPAGAYGEERGKNAYISCFFKKGVIDHDVRSENPRLCGSSQALLSPIHFVA